MKTTARTFSRGRDHDAVTAADADLHALR